MYLRKSFDKDSNYISTWLVFCLTLGIASIILTRVFPIHNSFQTKLILTQPKLFSAMVAGLFFFIGNAFGDTTRVVE